MDFGIESSHKSNRMDKMKSSRWIRNFSVFTWVEETWRLHFLLTEISPETTPLSPENKLLFMTSVVTGAPISGQARHTASAISPLTGGLADSQCGGWWGPELKFAGWDGIIIEGRSKE